MTTLDVDLLVAQARANTGLDDFGDESFLEPLTVLIEAIVREADLTDVALAAQQGELVRALEVRLRAQDWFTDFSAIADETVEPAVVIVGPQRSGTTKLFRLLATDPQWTKLYTWQAMNPVPLTREPSCGPDPRIAVAEAIVEQLKWLQPAHEMNANAPEMEAVLMSMAFMTNSPTRLVPTHQRYCETANYASVYAWLHHMLQFIQWQNGGPRRPWILKSPTHLPSLDALAARYPTPTLVMTHRHPRTTVASMLKLVELGTQNNARSVDRERIRDVWLRILTLNVNRFLAFRDAHGDTRWVDVGYRDVHRDAAATVQVIYEHVGMPFTDETAGIVAAWEQANPQHKEGDFTYELEDYGLSDADIERTFADYIGRFGHLF